MLFFIMVMVRLLKGLEIVYSEQVFLSSSYAVVLTVSLLHIFKSNAEAKQLCSFRMCIILVEV